MAIKELLSALPVIGTAMAVQERTKRDAADQFAAGIAFFGFISLFPLIAIAVAVTAAILVDQPERVEQVVADIQAALPGLGSAGVEDSIQTAADNGGTIGLIGGVLVLITGLRVTNALQTSTRFVFDLPLADANPIKLRLWQLASLAILGLLLVVGVGASGLATTLLQSELGANIGPVVPFLSYGVSALLDILLFWVAYRLFSLGSDLSWRDLLPGAVLGGIGWTALKVLGGQYAASQGDNAAGAVAGIIGLLLVFYLAGRFYVYGAELSAELAGIGATDGVPEEGDPAVASRADAAAGDENSDEAVPAAAGAAGDGTTEAGPSATSQAKEEQRGSWVPDEGSLADQFRDRGRLVDEPTGTSWDGGSEVVPWQAPAGSPLEDRRTRQAVAFASSALAVLTAGLLGRRS